MFLYSAISSSFFSLDSAFSLSVASAVFSSSFPASSALSDSLFSSPAASPSWVVWAASSSAEPPFWSDFSPLDGASSFPSFFSLAFPLHASFSSPASAKRKEKERYNKNKNQDSSLLNGFSFTVEWNSQEIISFRPMVWKFRSHFFLFPLHIFFTCLRLLSKIKKNSVCSFKYVYYYECNIMSYNYFNL